MPGPGPGLTTLVMESDESLEPGPNLKNGPEEHRPLARRLRHHYGEAAIKLKCDTKIDQDVESEVETLRVLHRPPESVTVQLHPRPHRRLANAVRPTAFGHDLFANIPVIVCSPLRHKKEVDNNCPDWFFCTLCTVDKQKQNGEALEYTERERRT